MATTHHPEIVIGIKPAPLDAVLSPEFERQSSALVAMYSAAPEMAERIARLEAEKAELLAALHELSKVGINEIHDWRAVAERMQTQAFAAIAKLEGRS